MYISMCLLSSSKLGEQKRKWYKVLAGESLNVMEPQNGYQELFAHH